MRELVEGLLEIIGFEYNNIEDEYKRKSKDGKWVLRINSKFDEMYAETSEGDYEESTDEPLHMLKMIKMYK
jgi:hypothetical protein